MADVNPAAEYGAFRGIYSEWTDADLDAARTQQASMLAQQAVAKTGESWTDLSSADRQSRAAQNIETPPPTQ